MAESQYICATGRRKDAVAKVFMSPDGSGKISINNKSVKEYLNRDALIYDIMIPLELTNLREKFDIKIKVKGGGKSGQAGAIRLGIGRALVGYDASLKKLLKDAGILTQDARVVERKKYGQKKARKRFQFSKR